MLYFVKWEPNNRNNNYLISSSYALATFGELNSNVAQTTYDQNSSRQFLEEVCLMHYSLHLHSYHFFFKGTLKFYNHWGFLGQQLTASPPSKPFNSNSLK